MGFLSRNRQSQPRSVIPTAELTKLASVGRAKYLDRQYVDVSGFYLPGFLAAGSPTFGPENDSFVETFLGELLNAARAEGAWAFAGALYVAVDFVGVDCNSPSFDPLIDAALAFMANAGVTEMDIPMGLAARWRELRQ